MTAEADPPPGFRSWRALYAVVLGALAVTIGLCAFLTARYQ